MSPELIDPKRFGLKRSRPTKYSDCYALGMVVYETVSGNVPFHGDAVQTVFLRVLAGERPPQGVRFTRELWDMLEKCWMFQPNNRPCIEEVLRSLKVFSGLPVPPSLGVDKEMISHGGGYDSTETLSGIPNARSDTTVIGGTATSPGSDRPTNRPTGGARAKNLGRKAKGLYPPTPRVDPNDRDILRPRLLPSTRRAVFESLLHLLSSANTTRTRHTGNPHHSHDCDYTVQRDASSHHHVVEASRQGSVLRPR